MSASSFEPPDTASCSSPTHPALQPPSSNAPSSAKSPTSSPYKTRQTRSPPRTVQCFVQVPTLSPSEKAKYHSIANQEIPEIDVTDEESVSEYTESSEGEEYTESEPEVEEIPLAHVVEYILAWRPSPEDAVEPPLPPNERPHYKSILPRSYLVKFQDRSYRRVQWVSHRSLLAAAPAKLRNFLQGGPKKLLLSEIPSEQTDASESTIDAGRGGSEIPQAGDVNSGVHSLAACPDAEQRIPVAWKTIGRVLDIRLWRPRKKMPRRRVMNSESEESDFETWETPSALTAAYDQGEEPSSNTMSTIEEFESLAGKKLSEEDEKYVAWALVKWDGLGYEDASWDSPPRPESPEYATFRAAFAKLLVSRAVKVPKRKKRASMEKDGKKWLLSKKFTVDLPPDVGQSPGLKLMPFQVDGVNWLCHNWNIDQNCILADEMGLGKTVQIVTYLGYIISTFGASPALVVVPNSTLTNWVREFERWAPNLRVVPFYGEAKARDIIKRYELFHTKIAKDTTGAKYHVLVTTYETITNSREFSLFKTTPRWEMLVVDEGQRLKSDASLIFRRLKELNTFHRVIMTGTPLNNNIRELFNLMNFLDPDEWEDLEGLSKEYEELTDELVKQLHSRLKPYFLRRIKSEVLQLPPKNEVIVPVSMAPLQKEIYRSILSQNLDILRKLAEGSSTQKNKAALTKTNMNNILMQLRKCLQHPYLVSETIEPRGLPPNETHERLVSASAKLRLLKMLLPKLRNRGHRVLLFSQFSIALDVVEDFLVGENIKYLRLDGSTKQLDRQKGMDEFNKPNSDILIYLLTTRAGGVGINLWSADTVIVFDPDFNPHQDLQAIARAHRYGQQKTVLVFKFMVKESAEERIMQTGKKKLILDHLIVQKMDDEEGSKEDVQSMLMFGAKALFEENAETVAREVHYSEHDIESLIEKTEKEGDQVEPESNAGSLFAFAKVWSADKEGVEDLADDVPENAEEADSWTKALELIAARRGAEKEQELTGRGVRRKAAAVFPQQQDLDFGDSPRKDKAKSKKRRKPKGKLGSDDSDFHAPASKSDSESDETTDVPMDVDDMLTVPGVGVPQPGTSKAHANRVKSAQKHRAHRPLSPIPQNRQSLTGSLDDVCGLCAQRHAPGSCVMTEDPENLAQYRLMLMQHAGDETPEERRAAIRVIDETLYHLGKIKLIYGQPLHLVETPEAPVPPRPAKKPRTANTLARPAGQVQPPVPAANIANQTRPIVGPSRIQGVTPTAGPSTAAPYTADVRRSHPTTASARTPTHPLLPRGSTTQANASGAVCVVCLTPSAHHANDCPTVKAGPASITQAIQRLSRDPARKATVQRLKSILVDQQRRLLAASSAQGRPASSAIDPSGDP